MNPTHTTHRLPTLEIEVRHLKLVLAIAEEGSLTSAGKRLFLTQSALSHQLSDLESRLRISLFSRQGRQLILTCAGRLFLESAREVVGKLYKTQCQISSMASGEEQGSIRLSTECYTCYHWLPPVLKRYHKLYPKVDIEIDVAATSRPIEALLEGSIDIALAYSVPTAGKLTSRELFEDELVAVVSPLHPYATKPYLKATDFSTETVIAYSAPNEESLFFRTVLMPAGVRPAKVLNVQLTEAILELVRAGLGIGVLSRWAVQREIAAGHLRAVTVTRTGLVRNWRVVYRNEKHIPRYLTAFAGLLETGPIKTSPLPGNGNITLKQVMSVV
jgi:LysR family transcriptional regulator for metE and metH